jgi:ABC-2 type transport system ATP-binding protein
MQDLAIEAQALVKRFGSLTAVDTIDLSVQRGSTYALLGPNGAGKTTTISMLTTMFPPTSGTARVAGYDVVRQAQQVRERIGVTFQEIVLDRDLTGRQVLDIHGRLYRQPADVRRKRITELVELVQLNDAIDRLTPTYSGGMRRRLELARGLMTDPEILFLDEPTQGLDPQNRVGIWRYLRDLKRSRGLTLLLTTHYMEEAEELADTVGIVDHGRLVAEGAPAQLVADLGADVIRVRGTGDHDYAVQACNSLAFVQQVERDEAGNELSLYIDDGRRRLAEVVALLNTNGFAIDDIALTRPTLGDVFLHYTGHALRDA